MALHPIAIYRRARGWRQADLAEKVGVSDTTVQNWEGGTMQPRPAHLPQLAGVLGVDPVQLGRELEAWEPAQKPARRRRVDVPKTPAAVMPPDRDTTTNARDGR